MRLAEDEHQLTEPLGITRTVIRDLRVLGIAAGHGTGLGHLAAACALEDPGAPRLELTRALIEYGAALRRANRRAEAREPLRTGLERSRAGGAVVLATRAQTELIATGARPGGSSSSGLGALTPSQQRVAHLAAKGLTTRQIAEALFISPKTVEFHLRHSYQKLGISSRAQLASQLAGDPSSSPLQRT
jgi:DNA-binding CsgD family transcriptional regulator